MVIAVPEEALGWIRSVRAAFHLCAILLKVPRVVTAINGAINFFFFAVLLVLYQLVLVLLLIEPWIRESIRTLGPTYALQREPSLALSRERARPYIWSNHRGAASTLSYCTLERTMSQSSS